MIKKSGDIDVIFDVLKATLAAYPHSTFLQSITHQYMERGSLSKKQLEGLYGKAQKVTDIPVGKLATLLSCAASPYFTRKPSETLYFTGFPF
jgi:hypothetical protein